MKFRAFFHPAVAALTFCVAATSATGCSDASIDGAGEQVSEVTVARPPQFVLFAFDGSLGDFWQESRAFAREAKVKFTYFVNGNYFMTDANSTTYTGPRKRPGQSDIGFGGKASEIGPRLLEMKGARDEGHEIASHAAGHFDGSEWTEDEWSYEFDEFNKQIFKADEAAGTRVNLGFGVSDLVGFRAPYLGHSPGLFKALKKRNFTYDTSKTDEVNYWPRKENGIWNFPLAVVRIVGSGKRLGQATDQLTLSMDYNFYVSQSKGERDLANKDVYQKEMLDTYMSYFQGNYFGNRAPVHIGHHFAKWNGGAYWEAMKTFAKKVCGQPEVKCVTYKELTKFMEANKDSVSRFQNAEFPPMAGQPAGARKRQYKIEPPATAEELARLKGDEPAAHRD